MLRRDKQKDLTTLTQESIATYKESLLKDMNLKIHIHMSPNTYVTRLSDWEDDHLTLAAPLEQLEWVILPLHTNLEISLMAKSALYTTQVQIMRTFKQSGTIYYTCQIVRPLIRKQQRQTFRLDTVISASFQLLPEVTDVLPLHLPYYKGTILNISLGGLCLVSDEQLHAGTLIYIHFEFIDTALSLMGKVLFDGETTPSGAYSHRIKFAALSQADENTLSRLIMTKQRLSRKH